jgi:tetratricopeptide (TPR) repeat protein
MNISKFKVTAFLFILLLIVFATTASAQAVQVTDPDILQAVKELKAENYEEAAEILQSIRALRPESSFAAFYLGLTYKQMQEYEAALVNFSDAASLKPRIKEAVFELAEIYYYLNKFDKSLDAVRRAEGLKVRPAKTAFLKGLIYSKLGKNESALKAFKRAKELDPFIAQSADYQAGLALIRMGKYYEAKSALKDAVISDPNSEVANFARQYSKKLNERERGKPFSVSLAYHYEHDSNVILKPSDQAAAGGITNEADNRHVATFTAEYAVPVPSPFGLKAQYSLYYTDNQATSSHNVFSNTIAVVPSYRHNNSRIDIATAYNHTKVGFEDYLQSITVSPSYTGLVLPNHLIQLGARYQRKDYEVSALMPAEERDGHEVAASIGWIALFAKNRGVFNVRYEVSKESAVGRHWDYRAQGGQMSLSIPVDDLFSLNIAPFGNDFRFDAAASILLQQYENKNANFGITRKDEIWSASAAITYMILPYTEIDLKYQYFDGGSNIAVYDYEREIAGAGITFSY